MISGSSQRWRIYTAWYWVLTCRGWCLLWRRHRCISALHWQLDRRTLTSVSNGGQLNDKQRVKSSKTTTNGARTTTWYDSSARLLQLDGCLTTWRTISQAGVSAMPLSWHRVRRKTRRHRRNLAEQANITARNTRFEASVSPPECGFLDHKLRSRLINPRS